MDKKTPSLNEKIKEKFKLFQGFRTKEEDQKLYTKLLERTSDEIFNFLSENLAENDFEKMMEEVKNAKADEEKITTTATYLSKIDNFEFKLNARIYGLLNSIMLKSLKPAKSSKSK